MKPSHARNWIPSLLIGTALGVLAAAALLVMQISVNELRADREAQLRATGEALATALRGLDPWFVDPDEAEEARRRLSRLAGALGLRETTVLGLGERVILSTSEFTRAGDFEAAALADPEAAQSAWAGKTALSAPFFLENVPFQAAFTPLRNEEGEVATVLVTVAGRQGFEELAVVQRTHRAVVAVAMFLLVALYLIGVRLRRHTAEVEAELEHRQRLAVAGQVAAGVVHEIRNPLGILRSTLEYLRDRRQRVREASPDDDTEELFQDAIEEVDRIEVILERFLSLARGALPEARVVHLGEVAESVIKLASKDMERRGMTLEGRGLEVGLYGKVDDRSLRQALLNLLINARQAMEEANVEAPRIVVRLSPSEVPGRARLHVEDDGPGFPAAVLCEPFRAFRTGRPEGTGLGLPLVARFAEQAGGSLAIENRPEGGGRATLELPTVERESP